MIRTLNVILTALCLLSASAHCAEADFPSRPVTVILSVSPGSAADALMRVIADKVGSEWKFPMVVRNEPGANGIIATQDVIRSTPNGSTLLQLSKMGQARLLASDAASVDQISRDVRQIIEHSDKNNG